MNKEQSDGTLVDRIVNVFGMSEGRPLLEQVRIHLEFIESILPKNSAREKEYYKLREAYNEATKRKGGDSAIVYALID